MGRIVAASGCGARELPVCQQARESYECRRARPFRRDADARSPRSTRTTWRSAPATRPMLPTSTDTISTATISPFATLPKLWPERVKRRSSGNDAPAYATASVFTVEEM